MGKIGINAKTKLCVLIGDPVEHSLSPLIHNSSFQKLGLNYLYLAFRVKDLASAISGIRALGIKGVSVTIPHKVGVMEYLDEVDPVSQNIGAVNTILNEEGRLKGYNTDGFGALKSIEEAGIGLTHKDILIIGSGGAARAIAFTLAMESEIGSLSILGRTLEKARNLALDLEKKVRVKVEAKPLSEESLKKEIGKSHILIHCTPVGMCPQIEESLINPQLFSKGLAVFDIVYNPLKTRLLKEAEERGCKIIPGIEMFINQALGQFELWTGVKAPSETMRKVVKRQLS